CELVIDHLGDAIEGALPDELAAHAAECDVCRDLIHDASLVADRVREADGGCVVPEGIEARVLSAIDARTAAAGPVLPAQSDADGQLVLFQSPAKTETSVTIADAA